MKILISVLCSGIKFFDWKSGIQLSVVVDFETPVLQFINLEFFFFFSLKSESPESMSGEKKMLKQHYVFICTIVLLALVLKFKVSRHKHQIVEL